MPQKKLSILCVASECFPLIKTGGLADVVGALPLALTKLGADVTVFLPGFPDVLAGLKEKALIGVVKGFPFPNTQIIGGVAANGLNILALDCPDLFEYAGNPYQDKSGQDRPDNGLKFALFSKIAADLAVGKWGGKTFNIVHAHDWQAALTAVYLDAQKETRIKTVLTIHNLAFQGVFPASLMRDIGLPERYLSRDGLEYWEKASFLKGGINFSDRITTVSPTYALEIQSDQDGMGFGGLLRAKNHRLSGILNGIDTQVWNPETDTAIIAPYTAADLSGKAKTKKALQQELGLRVDAAAPLFSVVSRLTTQKGLDLLVELLDYVVSLGGQIALLGSGDTEIERAFEAAALRHPTEISVTLGYNEPLAHKIQAGSDAILVPSRFEPCGLTQLCALRYGTVPVVGRVGGLSDTIIDANPMALSSGVATGLQFSPINTHMLAAAIKRTIDLFHSPDQWSALVQNALGQDVSWDRSAALYMDLYQSLL